MTESGMVEMRNWLSNQDWSFIYQAESANDKAKLLQDMLVEKFHEIFPEKARKVNSDDQPWISHKLKSMDRKRKREYSKHRRSEKWKKLDGEFKKGVKCAKKSFYQQMMSELMTKNSSQWYSSVKRMASHDQHNFEKVIIPDINNLSDEEQAKRIADYFAEILNQYDQLRKEDIQTSPINEKDIPQFKPVEVWMLLSNLKTNKSTIHTDISVRIYKELHMCTIQVSFKANTLKFTNMKYQPQSLKSTQWRVWNS